jgi:hypothetical protein
MLESISCPGSEILGIGFMGREGFFPRGREILPVPDLTDL